MKTQWASLCATAALSLGLAACGGGGPSVSQVKADFESPSGKTSSKEGVIAVTTQQDASGAALALAGGVPGVGLTAEGKYRGFQSLNIRNNFEPHARALYASLQGRAQRAQTADDTFDAAGAVNFASCFTDLGQQLQSNASGGASAGSASASITVDLGTCTGGDMTGTLTVDVTIEAEQSGAGISFSYKVSYAFANVCETGGEKVCLDGTIAMEASGKFSESSFTSSSSGAGNLDILTAWDLKGSWTEGGAAKTAALKGGLRTVFSADSSGGGSAALEYLFYVSTPEGEEWSYVLRIRADSTGAGSLEIEGSDGSIRCTVNSDGSGSCTATEGGGTATVSWTASESSELDAAWLGGE